MLHGSSEQSKSAQRKPRRTLRAERSCLSAEGGFRLRHLCTWTDSKTSCCSSYYTLTMAVLAIAVLLWLLRLYWYLLSHLELQISGVDEAILVPSNLGPWRDAAVQPHHLHAYAGPGVRVVEVCVCTCTCAVQPRHLLREPRRLTQQLPIDLLPPTAHLHARTHALLHMP